VSLVRAQDGSPRHFIAVIEDISSRKDSELAIRQSLAEKEVLLREIHHRVKNNMQVISSLLSLQASSTDDVLLSRFVQETRSRVRAMALIHEILYESSDLTGINLERYLSRLAASLTRMYGTESDTIRLEVEPKDITLGIDATVPCGLAINELISNSLKHGYPDQRDGTVSIQVGLTADDEISIVVRDDGVGIPAEVDIRNTDTMGLGLVVGLVERQLGGRLELDRSQGTRFTIIIDPDRSAA
jgi:two-component sensor histidine kinase